MRITLTVFFESPFWVGVFERQDGESLCAARTVFGAEPSDAQVMQWLQANYFTLRFSPAVSGAKAETLAENPKRRQRQAAKVQSQGVGTKSQQALQLARETGKLERRARARLQREDRRQQQFALRTEKRKARHRGH